MSNRRWAELILVFLAVAVLTRYAGHRDPELAQQPPTILAKEDYSYDLEVNVWHNTQHWCYGMNRHFWGWNYAASRNGSIFEEGRLNLADGDRALLSVQRFVCRLQPDHEHASIPLQHAAPLASFTFSAQGNQRSLVDDSVEHVAEIVQLCESCPAISVFRKHGYDYHIADCPTLTVTRRPLPTASQPAPPPSLRR